MINIILCGGSGTRLWPISRKLMPKQFVQLFDNSSLFQLTVKRNSKICNSQMIVSNSEQYFLAYDQLEQMNKTKNSYLLEPLAKNTAPAITLACLDLNYDDLVLVTPSDHLIKNEEEYFKVVNRAKELANENYLVTFGITPTSIETGFGYIQVNNEDVLAFHEKPDYEKAKSYVESGNYYWNSGMFCFKAGVFLDEIKQYSSKIYEESLNAFNNAFKKDMIRIKHEDMLRIPEDSIDFAVMEKSSKVKVVPSDINWSDLGSFDALYDELEKDSNGNTINGNHISIDSKNNLILANERKIATVDIDDLIIVDTADAILISKKGSSQKVKKVVEQLKDDKQLQNIHLTAHRPWGTYTVLEDTLKYKIKKIEVKPNKRLSLQKHLHRNEHWIVVSGTATVTVEDKEFILRPNESTYIKMGLVHRLSNEGKVPVVMIEVQIGDYLGEDDIIRLQDDFQRL
jgi:mannose-1-phosphate guanylyltransferase